MSSDSAQVTTRKKPVGRPTKYDPEMCEKLLIMGRQGYSITEMAAKLCVHRDTLYEWAKVHIEFSDTLLVAMTHSEAWWEHLAHVAIKLPTSAFNTGLWSKIMSARFPHTYRELSVRSPSESNKNRQSTSYYAHN